MMNLGSPCSVMSRNCANVMSDPDLGYSVVSCSRVSALLCSATVRTRMQAGRGTCARYLQQPPKMRESVVVQSASRAKKNALSTSV